MAHRKDHKIRVEDLFWQSPIPQPRSELTDEEFEAIFKERAREHREGLLGEPSSPVDWFISPAEGQEMVRKGSTYDPALGGASPLNYQALGIIPPQPESIFDIGFITDIKYDPKAHRIPVNPHYQHYPADISGVKFGTVLPDRRKIEGLILQAAEFAGVRPMYTEGFRTPAQNKLVGGDEHSKHLTGQAFDVSIRGGDTPENRAYFSKLEELLHPLGFGLEYFHSKNHIHIQYPRKER